jgi:hypothetical protein
MDCARSAIRIGNVEAVYSIPLEESYDEMSASNHEIEGALEENIRFKLGNGIDKILVDENISFSKLAGNINVINNTIEKFKNGKIKVLLLNATNYGSGLNLQMASDIIIYHEMTAELQTQIIGRSQRMGRTEQLNVYYLIHDNEKINCTNPDLNLNIFDDYDNNDLDKVLNYDNNNIEPEINIIN